MTTMMEWTRDKTLALIQEYRKRRGLWDMTHEDYRKKEEKHKLLVEVSNSLGGNIPIMEIEKKFHTLRTQYHREINRMKRKEPYNSKWFGFKCLQFLSSPKACRSNKGRIKAEITEDGTVTTKYIIREAVTANHDNSVGSGNENEEFLTLQRRPTTITYETVPGHATSTSSSRSHDLEKLIEETTDEVEEIEDAKPKMTIKEISVSMDHQQHHHDSYSHTGSSGELQITNVETVHDDMHHIEEVNENMDPISIHTASDDELSYHQTANNPTTTIAVSGSNASPTAVHSIPIPARIIKIQRRDTNHDQEYYEQPQHHSQHHHHHHQAPITTHHLQTVSPSSGAGNTTTKRIYYDASGHHTATILTAAPTSQQSSGMTILNATSASMTSPQSSKIHVRNSLAAQASATPLSTVATGHSVRDEYVTYGEYVANEMRSIKSKEILIALKHKINTALFEANMQELQK